MHPRSIPAAIGRGALAVLAAVHRFALWFCAQHPPVQIALIAIFLAAVLYTDTRPGSDDGDRPLDDVEALARAIRSEVGSEPPAHRLHVAWAVRNLAAERGQTIVAMACSPCGPQQARRPVSTRFRPTAADRVLAQHVLGLPPRLDPTGGASHFINPRLQDSLARAGRPGYRGRTYRVVRDRWIRLYGWKPYYRLGPTLEMWGNAKPRDVSQ